MQIFAHRGASGEFPENTVLAFEQAILQGADGIELDAHYHPGGKFVLLHDRFLQTKTTGLGLIQRSTLTDILALQTAGLTIPTLAVALSAIAGKCQVNIELKDDISDPAIMSELLTCLQHKLTYAVQHHGFSWHQFMLSSFNHHLLATCSKLLPQVRTAALIASNPLGFSAFADELKVSAINPCIDCLDPAFVAHAHQHHYQVFVYTVDHTEDIDKCLTLGVDGIFTNFPLQTRHYIETKVNSG